MASNAVNEVLQENITHERAIQRGLASLFAWINTDMEEKVKTYVKLCGGETTEKEEEEIIKLIVAANSHNLMLMQDCIDLMHLVHTGISRKHQEILSMEEA